MAPIAINKLAEIENPAITIGANCSLTAPADSDYSFS